MCLKDYTFNYILKCNSCFENVSYQVFVIDTVCNLYFNKFF